MSLTSAPQSRHQQDNRNLNWSPFGTTFTAAATDPTAGTGCSGCSAALGTGRPLGSNALPQNFMSRIQGYGNINLYESAATANYNALQVQVQRRAAKGLFLGVSYTWSKAMATALSGGTNDNSFVRPDQYNRLANYSPASFDRRQVLVVNYVYRLPKAEKFGNALTHLITNGWQISGVTIAQTGAPFHALRQCPEFIQPDRHRVLHRRVAAGDRAGLQPLHGVRQLDQLFEPLVFRTGPGWEHRARIRHQLSPRPGWIEL